MSIQAVAWVLENSLAAYSERLVLIAIANHVGPEGWAWPGIDAIAAEAFVDRSTVFRAIDKLVDMGELTVRKRPGKSNLYGLTALCDPSQSATPEGSQSATQGVASARPGGRNLQPEPLRTIKEPNAGARTREPTNTAPLIEEWQPDGAHHGPSKSQRETGLKAVRALLQKDETK